jgi:hypothetical protein
MKRNVVRKIVRQAAWFFRDFAGEHSGRLAIFLAGMLAAWQTSAQPFPPQGDDTTPSMGVFRIIVDPLFRPLLGPTGPPTSFSGYTGFHSSDGRLTSPMLIDSSTIIGRSNPHPRPTPFPQPLGAGSWDVINGYADYPGIPFLWFTAPNTTDEVLTEIKTFVLRTVNATTGNGCTNTLVPTAPPNYPMVKAGTFAGISPRSIGIVQEDGPPGLPDFPARSFFDIFVEVNLPPLPGTESSVAFPATGAVLVNTIPLIVTNLNLTKFPPDVVYIHGGNTNGVPLVFKTSNPPYWSAGQVFGTLALAGHGTLTNDCSNESALVQAVLGTPNAPAPELPPAWLRPTNELPSPGSGYLSLLTDTNPPGGSDTLVFSIVGDGAVYIRNINVANLLNPIPPPPILYTDYYNPSNVLVALAMSIDGLNFSPAQANGSFKVMIQNMSPPGSSMNMYETEMLQLTLTGVGQFGSFMIRESPTKQSLGRTTIAQGPQPVPWMVSSFFDVFVELSTDGGQSWIPANRSIRMYASAPPPAPGSLFAKRNPTAPGVLLEWLGPFTLQSSMTVGGTYSDVSGSTGGSLLNSWIVTFIPGQQDQFFRLRQ